MLWTWVENDITGIIPKFSGLFTAPTGVPIVDVTFASGEVVSANFGLTNIGVEMVLLGVAISAASLTGTFKGEETTEEVFCVENEDRGSIPNFSWPGNDASRSEEAAPTINAFKDLVGETMGTFWVWGDGTGLAAGEGLGGLPPPSELTCDENEKMGMIPSFSGLVDVMGALCFEVVVALRARRRALLTRALTSSSVISRSPPVSVEMR